MRVGIIGNGNLGSALAKLFTKNGFYNFNISDTDKFRANMTNKENIIDADILFLCVKPIDMPDVLSQFKNTKNKIIVSLVAGISSKDIEKYTSNCVVRMMPNLCIQYTKGTIPYYVPENQELPIMVQNLVKGPKLLKCSNEKLLDIATICNGSIPAILSYYAREYVKYSQNNGYSASEAISMYITSLEGTTEMMKEHSFDQIIHMVSSHKGVTQKGLQHLDENKIPIIIQQSLEVSLKHLSKLKN